MDDSQLEKFRTEFVELVHDRSNALDGILAGDQPSRENQYDALLVMHNLKGTASSLGLRQFAALCHRLEDLLCGDGFDYIANLPVLRHEVARLPGLAEAERAGEMPDPTTGLPEAGEDVAHLSALLYASTRRDGAEIDLQQLLENARRRNRETGVTGILLFSGFHFVQMLEGPREEINHTYQRILKDDRHLDIQLIGVWEISQRRFGDWSMGYVPDNQITRQRVRKLTGDDRFIPYDYPATTLVSLVMALAQAA